MPDEASADLSHIAIIMDGNGRWAKQRGLPRQIGHERGVEALRRVVEACRDIGLQYLTVFSFSSENWKRPASEVSALFGLLRLYVKQDLARLKADGVRVQILGKRKGLPDDILKLLDLAVSETSGNSRFTLNIAFNYGAREEIVSACKGLARQVEAGEITSDDITEDLFAGSLWGQGIPDPELLIRTSGEYRISNFLLWQIAYTELVFMDVLWPDFSEGHLESAIQSYRDRDRRYGGLSVDETSS
ncbi:MAG: di-trans,poly-cis-decaprenylcistransferase [Ponticaulis sp.]|nr:di-trans,poly-cis-decaprenylcistransferase [Ponticaulis sp.]|tara:strand:- start:55311 stop:56045 length:735 start_codon:yes stop_codon:yes gene_type:complete